MPRIAAEQFIAAMSVNGDDDIILALKFMHKPWTEMNVGNLFVLKKNIVEVIEIQIRITCAIDRCDARFLDDLVGIFTFVDHRARIRHDERLLPFMRETVGGVRRVADVSHAAQDGTRIESAAEGSADRHVASHADAARVEEQFAEARNLIVIVLRNRFQMIERVPPTADLQRFALTQGEAVPAEQMIQSLQHTSFVALDETFIRQRQRDHRGVEFRLEPIQREEGFHLRGEREMILVVVIDHRLHAETVARDEKLSLF